MTISFLSCKACGNDNPNSAAFCMTCGAPTDAQLLSARNLTGLLRVDQLLKERYRILIQIGRGGFAAVYKAEDLLFHNRLVAIKEMSQSGMSPQELTEAVESFKHEAQLLANLQHPHLPRIHDHFSDGGRWYLVMDFIEGETLEVSIQRRVDHRFSLKETLDIGLQLCSVLDYLHTCHPPIIFRDLKPANILSTPQGHLYLIDFGIARHFKPGQVKDTIPFGSPGYAAPEQYGKAQTTQQSDIYSLGVLLHHLLTGSDPSEKPFLLSPLRLYGVGLTEMEELVTHMTNLDPQKRPTHIAEVRTELQRIVELCDNSVISPLVERGTPQVTFEERPSQVQLQQLQPVRARTSRRNFLTGGLIAGSAMAAAAFLAFNQRKTFDQNKQPQGTIFHPEQLSTQTQSSASGGDTRYIYHGHTDQIWSVAWSPQGNMIASVGKDDAVQVWRADTGKLIFSTGLSGARAVAWSPDGKRLAAINAKSLLLWDITTGKPSLTYPLDIQGACCMSWASESSLIAIGGDSGLELLDTDTKAVLFRDPQGTYAPKKAPLIRHIALATKGYLAWTGLNLNAVWYKDQWGPMGFETAGFALAWSPGDSKYLAFGVPAGPIQVVEVLRDSYMPDYRGHETPVQALAWSPNGKYIASAAEGVYAVHVWEAMSGKALAIYQEHSASVESISWSPDSTFIASGGDDKTVRLWKALP